MEQGLLMCHCSHQLRRAGGEEECLYSTGFLQFVVSSSGDVQVKTNSVLVCK